MRKLIITRAVIILIFFTGCHYERNRCATNSTDSFSVFIPVDTANKMLGSYLNSIDYSHNDTDLRSVSVDADQLRSYLNAASSTDKVTTIKLMFAHTLSYANSPHAGTNAGYKSNALTIIIAAVKANGDYVYLNGNTVLDYTAPCPTHCLSGQAANPYLIMNSPKNKQ